MILVTGASGLLGSKICKSLANEGHKVKALVRERSNLSLLDKPHENIDIVYGDILIPEEVAPNLNGVKVIIHCAAVVSFTKSDKAEMDQVNVQGTAHLTNLAIEHNVEYFIHMSSVAAIGRGLGSQELNETSQWEDGKWNSNYAVSKRFAELEVWRSIEEGLSAVILNPSVILSDDSWSRSSGKLFKYIWDENTFYSSGIINYVDIKDVIQAVHTCLKVRPKSERFILNGGYIRYKIFFDEVARRFNKKAPTVKATRLFLQIGWLIESLKSFISGKQPVITRETINISRSEISFDNSKAKKELKINFTPLSETLDATCASLTTKSF